MAVAVNSGSIELQENAIYESYDTIPAIQEKDLKRILQSGRRCLQNNHQANYKLQLKSTF